MQAEIPLNKKHWISNIAKAGLIAKGFVYLILGILAFMAAFEIGGQQNADANRSGVFNFIMDAPAGKILLIVLSIGLICYSLWRGIQAFANDKQLKWAKRLRYLFSGLVYLSVAITAFKITLQSYNKNGDSNRNVAAWLMENNYGQWLVGIMALIIAGVGFYQIWYGLSETYKKHVKQPGKEAHRLLLLYSGKIGYVARGMVWLIIAYLLVKAALRSDAGEAGDSGKAFLFIENMAYGSYLLGALGVGLMAYGVFNFIRARYEAL